MIIFVLVQSLVLITSLSLSLLGTQAQYNPSVPPPAEAGCVSAGPLNGMEFAYIPSGSFLMGSAFSKGGNINQWPRHTVHINSFQLMTTEVTQGMWEEVMGCNPSDNPDNDKGVGNSYPVYSVSWDDCQEFINNLNEIDTSHTYRLPSESEWEYACRAGTATIFFWGDSDSDSVIVQYCWYSPISHYDVKPVAGKEPNPWGLYDICGNVWEWYQDHHHTDYNGAPTDGSAWETPGLYSRVTRGGKSIPNSRPSPSAHRFAFGISANSSVGFRLARSER
ncbi:MAG: formylglycine-generating enzyme family protein [Candidatus Sabulitectum sp.]|nr:formylglycine-generating enzyme family protein [Candidatus Sabulitectum sp.]